MLGKRGMQRRNITWEDSNSRAILNTTNNTHTPTLCTLYTTYPPYHAHSILNTPSTMYILYYTHLISHTNNTMYTLKNTHLIPHTLTLYIPYTFLTIH